MRRARFACAVALGAGVAAGGSSACTQASRSPHASLSVQGASDAPVAPAEPTPKSVEALALEGRAGRDASEARENQLIARTLKKVSDARGLAATRAVPGVTLSREALIRRVKEHVAREIPPAAIRQEGLVLQLLGFVPLAFDYEAETFKLLEAQLAGFYEPSDGTMYMAADLDDDNADATLAHELVHALQDQHFDLKPHSKYTPGQSDKAGAFSALAEGDATSAMADVLVGRAAKGKNALDLPEEMFVAQVLGSVSSGPGASAPHIMRTSLVSPYIQGTLFVHALRRSGGWAAVDRAWKDLPTTTEQILHPAKWRSHEAALDVPAPTFASLGEGWSLADEDTYGELGLRLAFEEWIGADEAADAAAGWGGDRGVLVTASGERAALAIRVRYDAGERGEGGADAHVRKTFASLVSGMETTVGRAKAKDASFVCVERPKLGPLAAMRGGREVVLLVAPTRTDAASWAAAGDCATAKKWAAEILATPAVR